jgi:hypothetical protein
MLFFRRVSEALNECLPNLETLVLTNNMVGELVEIDNLQNLANLRVLSLLFNPVSTKEHYRAYTIYKLPQLKLLDFRKIKMKVILPKLEVSRVVNVILFHFNALFVFSMIFISNLSCIKTKS